ncbi:MAG: ATP-binding protein [Sulfitobacter sp.]
MYDVTVPDKWRPSLAQLIAFVVGLLVVLPFFVLIAARITSNQFVRETEANLHSQAAIYAARFAQAYADAATPPEGHRLSAAQQERLAQDWHPIEASLTVSNRSILPPRPDPMIAAPGPDEVYLQVGKALSDLAIHARKTTLVGFLALDLNGTIIAKSGTETGTLQHIKEVQRALRGDIVSVARWRDEEYRNHSLRSVSRDTKFRVYVAHPVSVADHVVGVIYLSRTPSNLNKYLFQQRHTLMWLTIGVLIAASLIGAFLWRFLTRPLLQLQRQAQEIAIGETETQLPGYGVKELAGLGQSLINMGATLRKNAAAVQTYTKHATHELKSPVTSIMGAAELLEAPQIQDARRRALAATIKADAARMDRLLNRMREMARGQSFQTTKQAKLNELLPILAGKFDQLCIEPHGDIDQPLPISQEAALICFGHLLENATEHDAKTVQVTFDAKNRLISLRDDGTGISPANVAKVAEPFFTTKRETGGTGMGLTICAELIAQQGGDLEVVPCAVGTEIKMIFEKI